jgi:hypothetical protein
MRKKSRLSFGNKHIRRDNEWLLQRVKSLWQQHFSDIPHKNEVYIGFGRRSRYRFGSIRLRLSDNSTHITINGLFREPQVPVEIVDHTIAHELVHYIHGFSSLHPRMHRYPHRGGVIDQELKDRGLGELLFFYKRWIKQYVKELERN